MGLPPDLQSGDYLTAGWLNEVKNAVLASLRGDGAIVVNRSGANATIGLAARIPGISPGNVRVVKVVEDGVGFEGDAADPCSFTYTVYDLDETTQLAAGLSPLLRFHETGVVAPAPPMSLAVGATIQGAFTLIAVQEKYLRENACEESP